MINKGLDLASDFKYIHTLDSTIITVVGAGAAISSAIASVVD